MLLLQRELNLKLYISKTNYYLSKEKFITRLKRKTVIQFISQQRIRPTFELAPNISQIF